MYKRTWIQSGVALLVLIVTIVCCCGCGRYTYECFVAGEEDEEHVYLPEAERDTISIGTETYAVTYQYSMELPDGTMMHRYGVVTEQDGFVSNTNTSENLPTISLCEDGSLMSFFKIRPFEAIGNIGNLTEEELRVTVENLLGDFADCSVYNTFELRSSSASWEYTLNWSVTRDAPCNIALGITIDSEGFIDSFSKIELCPEDFSKPFISDRKRDRLIMQALEDDYAQRGTGLCPERFEIFSELLTCYEGEKAIYYWVTVIDDQGFREMRPVLIVQKRNG